jgi:iron complex outermembrane receptor protein
MRFAILLAAGCASTVPSGTAAFARTAAPVGETAAAPGGEGELIVTARRREELRENVPIAVSALSGEALRQRQIYAVKDIATYVPGLNISSDSVGRAFVSIRGIGTTLIDTVQPGVGIFIDGIYQPSTSYLNSPLVDVARVEVLRGPQGTLFGNNTLGGAINVITRQPGNDLEGRVDGAFAGPDDFKSLSGAISGAIVPDKVQVRVGAAYHHQDGFQTNTLAGGDQNPLTQKSVNGTVRLLPAEAVILTVNGNYDRVDGGNSGYLGVAGPTDYRLDNGTNQRSLATIEYRGASAKGEFDAAGIDTKITAVLAYNRRTSDAANDGDYGPVDFIRSSVHSKLTTKTVELRFDTRWSDGISTLIGVFANRSTTDSNMLTRIVPRGIATPVSIRALNEGQALFGTVFIQLDPTLDLAIGGRFDHQKVDASNATTAGVYRKDEFQPRVTLSKTWTPGVMTYASIARGVRGGGQNGPGAPNLIYKGDSVWTYELGAKFAGADHVFSLDTALFYNDYDDFIGQNSLAPSTTGAGFVAINLNTGHVASYGLEAEVHIRPTRNWRIDGGLTLLHARITNDDQYFATTRTHVSTDHIIFTPDWTFNLSTSYKVPLGDDALLFDAGIVAKGSRYGSSLDPMVAPKLNSYHLVNASVTFDLGRSFSIGAFGANIFNEKYIESYIDKSALTRAGLAAIARNLALQGDRRRYGVRGTVRF